MGLELLVVDKFFKNFELIVGLFNIYTKVSQPNLRQLRLVFVKKV